jgi:HD-GYP domain-containing protein (c-di-GMP phosphodiesterase class II)
LTTLVDKLAAKRHKESLTMVATQTSDLIDSAAAEAFIQLAKTTDKFERYENAHAQRVAAIADEIAQQFHLARHDRGSLYAAALLHDLGEVAMERDYIQATGPLSNDERIDLARHPVLGEREASRVGADRAAQLLVRWHQEWWNGAGYPDALRREEIPLTARILRLADSYAALTDARPFRPAMTEEAARSELIDRAGIEFDPSVVSIFLSLERFPELESFARIETDEPVEERPVSGRGWDLFGSFSK